MLAGEDVSDPPFQIHSRTPPPCVMARLISTGAACSSPIASMTLDLPDPLGPTSTLSPRKSSSVASLNESRFLNVIERRSMLPLFYWYFSATARMLCSSIFLRPRPSPSLTKAFGRRAGRWRGWPQQAGTLVPWVNATLLCRRTARRCGRENSRSRDRGAPSWSRSARPLRL